MRLYGRSQFTSSDIARLATEPFVHKEYSEHLFSIYDEVSRRLMVPARSVMLTGSAFTGESFREKRPFLAGVSDLDVAVVDRDLFRELLLCASRATRYFRDQTPFQADDSGKTGAEMFISFRKYAFNKGIIRPDLMPNCDAKEYILDLSRELSNKFIEAFSSVSIFIYGDEEYFVAKVNDAEFV